ncbi:SelT/SelW/SelH family protein [Vibrio harveyi]|jgi:selenoprotein W-related protein|uniref:SelT/SelW/SelH family protein n=1 Tax=Vibrio harveyi TaxID=669 RepID=UPI0023807181|nr:SelT/SelW/SelH family protein [Vibrio harveyi]HDM8197630.1 SelT/SelW/SelH family protein [Vibrio harveyi]HDM8202827.1 SelT/SelW/SelH family protein [Vibrio harveyi]
MDKAIIDIYYCRQCNWMLRSTWLSQELLHTFSEEIKTMSLHPDTGGRFEIFCNGTQIWERKKDGGFPEAKVLKQRVRDIIDPERDLGHSDKK